MDMANQKGSFIEYQKTGIASFVWSFIWNKIPTHKCKMRLSRTPKFQYDSWPELIDLVTWAIIVQAFLNEYKISIWECRDATIILQKALEKKPKWYDSFCFVVKELWPAVPGEESEEWPRLSKEREKTAQRSKAFYHSWWRVLCYLRYEVQRYINKRKPGFIAQWQCFPDVQKALLQFLAPQKQTWKKAGHPLTATFHGAICFYSLKLCQAPELVLEEYTWDADAAYVVLNPIC